MICFKCGGELTKNVHIGTYFTHYTCDECFTPYCLAHDSRGTWSWLKTILNDLGQKISSHYVGCTKEMQEANTQKEKVIFN